MNQEKISYEQLLSLADEMKRSANNMEQVLSEVRTLFSRVGTGDVWSGTSAAAAKEQFDRLSAKFPEFYQATNTCYTHLTQVVENYKNVDRIVSNS